MPRGLYPRKQRVGTAVEYDDMSYFKSGKARNRAWKDLFRLGHSAEAISRLSCTSLPKLMTVLGADKVVSSLFLHSGWPLKRIAKELSLPLPDVARLLGGITRSGAHLRCDEEAEEVLEEMRKGKPAA